MEIDLLGLKYKKIKKGDKKMNKEKKYEFTEKELKDLFNHEMSKEYKEFRKSLDVMNEKHLKELQEINEQNRNLEAYNWVLMLTVFILCILIIFVK